MPHSLNGHLEKVTCLRFWEVHITEETSWTTKTSVTVGKAQQCLYYKSILKRPSLPQKSACELLPQCYLEHTDILHASVVCQLQSGRQKISPTDSEHSKGYYLDPSTGLGLNLHFTMPAAGS